MDEVLIVRSFTRDDPVRTVLEKTINRFAASAGNDFPRYRFVDVGCEEDLIGALVLLC